MQIYVKEKKTEKYKYVGTQFNNYKTLLLILCKDYMRMIIQRGKKWRYNGGMFLYFFQQMVSII